MTARSTGPLTRAEDTVATLGVIVLSPAEVVLRRLFGTGAPGAAPFTSHLTLIFGLVMSTLFHVQADRPRAARDAFAELTARMKKTDNADDAETQSCLHEARELIQGTGGGSGKQ